MKNVYNIDDLRAWSEPAIRLGVIGDPVAHSFSPQMQMAALGHCEIPLQYARFQILPQELPEAIELFALHRFIGLNVTVPHKAAVMRLTAECYEPAKSIAAVNTLARSAGGWHGFNTDAPAFGDAIRDEFDLPIRDLRILILGAGGAASAIEYQCKSEGSSAVHTWSRRAPTDLRELASEADLIVNATPVGLSPADPPLITRDVLRPDQFVYDTIYNPARTRLLEEAAAAGARVANGLSMLIHQGARSFQIWFGQPAPIEVMRHAVAAVAGPRLID